MTQKGLVRICMLLSAVLLAGCGKNENDQVSSLSEAACTDGGKVLNIYSWNDEFEQRMTDYYPGYTDNGDGTGSIGDTKVVWTISVIKYGRFRG